MEDKNNELITYCFKLPAYLKEYFQKIANNEQRDLSFIIRRILIKEKYQLEQETETKEN
jgi:hypothetical protein